MLISDKHVWYVCYGSNIYTERFMTYINGGRIPGKDTIETGCHDKTPPKAEKKYILPYELYFAGNSKRWGNAGVAFIKDEKSKDKKTYGKMYLISLEQFIDVVCQENNCQMGMFGEKEFLEMIHEGKYVLFPERKYGKLMCIGYDNDIPLVTFTANQIDTNINSPSEEYIKMLAKGIGNTHGLNNRELADYFQGLAGVRNYFSIDELRSICII